MELLTCKMSVAPDRKLSWLNKYGPNETGNVEMNIKCSVWWYQVIVQTILIISTNLLDLVA